MEGNFHMDTDTATLCCYDLAALEHRLEDTADWWSIPEDELQEVNAGNCLFLNLGDDGLYKCSGVCRKHRSSRSKECTFIFRLLRATFIWARQMM
ncbi:DUF6386 family protein [Paenibacillus silvae]|uniref:DUF6386 family protein n=1 Tax=Paenibacillus silvae TaxID=1325358 RepID=UPI0023E7BE58|nr:DUF6386 family protein [Paenibacillus silvae]